MYFHGSVVHALCCRAQGVRPPWSLWAYLPGGNWEEGGGNVRWTTSPLSAVDLRATSGPQPLLPPLSILGSHHTYQSSQQFLAVYLMMWCKFSSHLRVWAFSDHALLRLGLPRVSVHSYSRAREEQEAPSASPGIHTYASLCHCVKAARPAHHVNMLTPHLHTPGHKEYKAP